MGRVRFWVDVVLDGDLTRLADPDPQSVTPALRDALGSAVDGAVVIDGEEPLEVADDLTAVASDLCFVGPTAVLTDPSSRFVFRATQATRHTVMVPLGTQVRVFGEGTPVVTADVDELLPDLYRCGMRIVGLLEAVGEPEEAAVTVGDLRASAAELRSHLAERGIEV